MASPYSLTFLIYLWNCLVSSHPNMNFDFKTNLVTFLICYRIAFSLKYVFFKCHSHHQFTFNQHLFFPNFWELPFEGAVKMLPFAKAFQQLSQWVCSGGEVGDVEQRYHSPGNLARQEGFLFFLGFCSGGAVLGATWKRSEKVNLQLFRSVSCIPEGSMG